MPMPLENTGFTPPSGLGHEGRKVAELVTIVGLALCTIVAATAVSVGIAHADVASDVVGHEGSVFGIALLLGLLFAAMGGLSVFTLPSHKPKKH